jgi:hypothetical protein
MADRARRCDEGECIAWGKQNHVECEAHARAHNEFMRTASDDGFDGRRPTQVLASVLRQRGWVYSYGHLSAMFY